MDADKEGLIKMETSSSFSEHAYPFLATSGFTENSSSLGFLELLGLQDFTPSFFDATNMLQLPTTVPAASPAAAAPSTPEVVNQPATPNSSSVSSASSDDVHAAKTPTDQEEEEQEDQEKTKKLLKPKKTNPKKQREPRFAFMTKSEVDHLEDGYRWRKYGQKAVKNSPFPRSYYRCTMAACNVKKRVERSFSDPTIVVTTYEGQHTHPSPVMPRPIPAGAPTYSGGAAATFSLPMTMQNHNYQYHQLQQQQQQQHSFLSTNNLPPLNLGSSPNLGFRFCNPMAAGAPASTVLTDYGLLQDLVPSHMLKED